MNIESKIPNSKDRTSAETLQQSEAEFSELKNNLQRLLDSFNQVVAITDSVEQEYAINKEARLLDIPLESYRRMLENYRKPKKVPSKFDTVIKPVSLADKKVGDFIAWFQSISIFKLTTVFSQVTLLIAMISFFLDAPRRQQQAIDAARRVVESASNQSHSKARLNSLKTLNKYCVSLTGVNAANADLEGVQLNKCYVHREFSEMFAQWPPQLFKYQGFDFSYANLQNVNLNQANLEGADLRGVNLQGAYLIETNLKGANLEGANLEGAKLWRANLEGANLQNTNLQKSGLGRANFQRANFQGANLADAKLYWSNFQGASFLRSNLQGANLSRANLQGADFYKANLKGASLRYADFRQGTNLREADIEDANLEEAQFGSINELKRAKNWQKALKNSNWEEQITRQLKDTLRIGLIKSTRGSLFNSYQKGMELAAADQKVEIVSIESESGVDIEAKTVKKLIAEGADAILLLPEDAQNSVATIKEAYESGVAVITLGGCINEVDANRYLFSCYRSDREKMGYDSGNYLATWAAKNFQGKELNVGILDATSHDTFYPSLQGFYAAMKAANIRWSEVASTDAALRSNVPEVKEMLKNNPKINILWGGSNASTDVAIQAVKELGLEGKVFVFGMSNLDPDKADMLLNPKHPLELIIDQSGRQVGYDAAQNAIAVLNGNVTPYKFHLVNHRVISQDDEEAVKNLLKEAKKYGEWEQKSSVIKEQNKPTQDNGVGSTTP
ncbi:MAG TPA: pentapeptide repeat-containing protein [Kamptonema sp.]|nr:pentapeptide repeat-containing protein [Kamptonema sp.]